MQRLRRVKVWRIAALALLLSAPAGAEPGRLALVIGNGAYVSMPQLPACPASARLMVDRLKQAGFEVIERTDPSGGGTGSAFAALARRITETPDASVVIYVCGYAEEFDGRAFLLPVTASLARPSDVLTQGMSARSVSEAAFRGAHVGLAVLDLFPAPGAAVESLLQAVTARAVKEGQFIVAAAETQPAAVTPLAHALGAELEPPAEANRLLARLRRTLAGSPATVATAGDGAGALMPAATQAVLTPVPAPLAPPAPVAPPIAPPVAPPAPAAIDTMPASAFTLDEAQYSENDRRHVQAALLLLGYYAGAVDGQLGPGTRAAIRRYQHEIGAPMTGVLLPPQAARLLAGRT